MAITGHIVDPDGSIVETYTAANYTALRAYATSLGLLVGSHGGEGGPGPTQAVSSALLQALANEHSAAPGNPGRPAAVALLASINGRR